ncbi:T9SS type A sorting domain-containing protein [Mariniflexile aquimaris]|uniref:T9SS type A sorting domain-containing protein n=1 Tax=Mariniflexile aquimaris TaxID=881009 RepID=A0ABW3BUA6_9FLAO
MIRKIQLLVFCIGFANTLNAQIFTQDFSASTNVSSYVSATPDSGQFNGISPDGANLITTINNGALRFNRTGTASIYAYRNFTFSTNPTFVQFKMDFEASGNTAGTQSPIFSVFIGNGFSSASSGTTSAYASRFGILVQSTPGNFKIGTVDNIGGAPQSAEFTGKQTITYVVNNSGSDQTYTGPDASIEAVANGKMDVWVGTTRGINDFSLKNTASPTADITGFKIQATSASGTGVYDFDNIEMRDLINDPVTPPTINLPDTPPSYLTLTHPFIWASYPERQQIVDNIHQYTWASSLYSQLKARVDAVKNAHESNPAATLSAIPAIPGVLADRTTHTDIVASMNEASIMYYLTNDASYAQYAADILSHYMKYLAVQPVQKYQEVTDGLMFNDGWLESRTLFPRIALTYDFLYNYVNDANNTVYDLAMGTNIQFNDATAQTTVANLSDIVFMSIRAPKSNHSVLAGNGNLFNLLMISDDTKREQYFDRFYNNTSETFDAYTWTLNNFTENGVWPETFSYSKESHALVIQSMNVIDRYKPSLDLVNNNIQILDGYIGYANWIYPSDELMRFGDTGTEGDMNEGYQWILRIANRKNLPTYSQFAKQNLKYYYEKAGGYNPQIVTDRLEFTSPLQLLWGENVEETQTVVPPNTESTYNLKHAGIVVQRNYNTPDIINDGMMYYSGGAAYVHTHSTGIDMELYGKGQIFGAESGSGSYGSDEHENYRVRHAAHNTVIVNGSGKRGGNNWLTKVANVDLLDSEPKSFGVPIATNFSFSTQYINDAFNSCEQQRTNSIIRTSATTGYYFDILRSNGKVSNNYHDYIYHNIGDAVSLTFSDDTNVPLSTSTKYATDSVGDVTGWTFFENVNSSALTTQAVNATFALNTVNKYMNVLIPEGINREYATALAPYTKGALNGYSSKQTPVITMRKYGEAWNEPFIAIYEPSGIAASTIKSTSYLYDNAKVIGVKVVSEVNGKQITDVIISNDNDNLSVNLSNLNIAFTGRFAVVRTQVNTGSTDVSLYMGKGQQLTFMDQTINGDSDGKAYSEYSLNYELSTKDISLAKRVVAYPNPTTGIVNIEVPNASYTNISIEIYNLQGQLIKSGKHNISDAKIHLDLSDVSKGIYVLKLNLDNPKFIKVIKK